MDCVTEYPPSDPRRKHSVHADADMANFDGRSSQVPGASNRLMTVAEVGAVSCDIAKHRPPREVQDCRTGIVFVTLKLIIAQ
jgi:hypothetical protein